LPKVPNRFKHKWAIVIDLDRCTGCGACVTACHAENNLALADKEYCRKGRAANWIRVKRFWMKGPNGPRVRFLPVPCQQCDKAPCETVCPVFAAYHSPDGLNIQVYNRCIGTRYCANNCPYSVRFFNWFPPHWPDPLPQALNPDVTVRSKGVMEKCTFCIQRIQAALNQAQIEGREIGDGEIQPACVQTCPPGALVFGDVKDPNSRVSQLVKSETAYRLLESLGTRPAVVYLARVEVPHDAVA
jgi:molybdopterin-containing oxidoreductase family iron-sulfur binding subunit